MALTDTDRRRFLAATALTLLALPALWWANTSESSSAPNLAVAGIDADLDVTDDGAGDGGVVGGGAATAPAAALTPEPNGEIPPVFLEGPASAPGAGLSQIAVPAKPVIDGVQMNATFRSDVGRNACIAPGITSGSEVTVVNLANNRSVTCTTLLAPGTARGDIVLHTSAFASIADLTDAPISVEIRR